MTEYVVRIKDLDQDVTHVIKQLADSQREANLLAYEELTVLLDSPNLEIL